MDENVLLVRGYGVERHDDRKLPDPKWEWTSNVFGRSFRDNQKITGRVG